MKKWILISFIMGVILFQFCSKNLNSIQPGTTSTVSDTSKTKTTTTTTTSLVPNLPTTPYNYLPTFPSFIQTALAANDNMPSNNPITNDGATLGRVLFYDKQLSVNNTVSCGSCHAQNLSFEDTLTLSKGFNGGLTDRNSMALLNIRFFKSGFMFWDERATSVEKQALQPIQNHVEMGLTLALLESKVQAESFYPALFQKAFGSPSIDSVHIAMALAQFERSIVTYQSRYDSVKQGFQSFTAAEAAGETFFTTSANSGAGIVPLSCGSCHTPPMFINSSAPPFGFADAADSGINGTHFFKSGSLRNIAIRKSLFHNGSVSNVLTMLTAGTPGTRTQPIPAHSITSSQVQNVMAFLNTLTDYTVLTDPKFSNPFKK
jgi:cytochrome c peroxidase